MAENVLFKVSGVFSSNMVIQRDEKLIVWGFAGNEYENREVSVSFLGETANGTIKNGKWFAEFENYFSVNNQKGNSLVVFGPDNQKIEFEDILVGDVYMCIGQSNIRFPLDAIIPSSPEGYPGNDYVISDDDNIRLNRSSIHDADGNEIYPVRGTTELCEDVRHGRTWQLPSEGALEFSALGFFIAQQLIKATKNEVPIGMVEIDADGQALNAFMPNELADKLHTDDLIDGVYKGMWHVGPEPSRYVYNHFMYPYQQLSICGIVWYQGESDFNDVNRPVFAHNYSEFITELRNRFDLKNHDIPVYMVEIPTCYPPYQGWPEGELWAYIDFGGVRAEMGKIPNILPDSYLAASSDLWLDDHFWNSLHPYCKYPQAIRVSNMILANQYDIGDIDYVAGPQFNSVDYEGNKASVSFRHVAQGLTSSSSSDIYGFEVKDTDGWHAPKNIREYGDCNDDGICDSIELINDKEIFGVRYNAITTDYFPEKVNLCNSEGIPAVAFCDEKQ